MSAMMPPFDRLAQACTEAADAMRALSMALHPDENFISNAQIERHFKLAQPIPRLLDLHTWPADLPTDFDHQLLRLMGLREQCALMYYPDELGWRVMPIWQIADDVAASLIQGRPQ